MILHGLKGGRVVEITEVPKDEWGLRCGCFCPNPRCGEPLIARSRDFDRKRKKHFAHASGADCAGAAESALHLLAKQIVGDEMSVMAPRIALAQTAASPTLTLLRDAELLRFEEVQIEQETGGLRPDVTGATKGLVYHIEILVTHAVDEKKRAKANASNWTVLEIDIGDLLDQPFTIEQVRDRLMNSSARRRWVRHAELERAREQLDHLSKSLSSTDDCPAGLGKVPRVGPDASFSASRPLAPCKECPACYGTDGKTILCLWGMKIFALADLSKAVTGVHAAEPRFFSDYRTEITKRAAANEAWVRAQAAAADRRRRLIEEMMVDAAPASELEKIDSDKLHAALCSTSSRILREYKRTPDQPISYLLHLLSDPDSNKVVCTFRVGPDRIAKVETGSRPRDGITGEGHICLVADSYQVTLHPTAIR